MKVNEKIREYLESHGITQKFLCDKTGITPEKMSNLLNGKRKVTGEELLLISEALNISANIFLDR